MATEKMGAYKKKGAAESKELSEKGPVDGRDETMNKEGSDTMGPGKYMAKKEVEGPGRSMGYTQNFGPARVNGYSKGAAKVNSIMGKGAAQTNGLSLDDLASFALKKGDKVTKDNENRVLGDERNAAVSQFQDSLNLTANNQAPKAKQLYGDQLQFGNSVSPNSSSFTAEDKTRQNAAGIQFMTDYRESQNDKKPKA